MVQFRYATQRDVETVSRIELKCFPVEQAAERESFKARIAAFPEQFILMEKGKTVVGYINGACISQRYISDEMYADASCHCTDGEYQSVFGLCVLPEYRHKGYAHQLMELLAYHAKEDGRKAITLTCLEERVGLYETMGFRNEGVSESNHGDVQWYNMVREL